MKQMRIKHNETGRSMVEMLGVLAIMGVLSIGGVAGYRYAVDKMNANEIINELKKRAITASQQRVLGQSINLSEYGDRALIKGTYAVTPTDTYNGNASQFALAVAGVPERVCDMILDSDWALPAAKAVNGGSCVEGANGNTMTFAFNNTLGSGDAGNGETPNVTTAVTATETEVSESDEIWTDLDETATETEVTETETEVTESDEIWTDLDETEMSESDEIWTDLDETEVSESDEIWTDLDETATESTVTETVTKQQICDSSGYCYDCSHSSTIQGVNDLAECSKCDGSGYQWTGAYHSSGPKCVPCSQMQAGQSDREDNIEESCGKCGLGVNWLSVQEEKYYSCASGSEEVGTKPICSGDNRTGFVTSSGYCISCSTFGGYTVTAEECAKCDNTSTPRVMSSGGNCALPCESGQFMSSSGTCRSCSLSYGESTTAEECAKCDNTGTPRVMSSGGYCALPCESGEVMSENGTCVSPCSSGQFMLYNGSCMPCSDYYSRSATAEECAKCDNTSTPRVMAANGSCVLKKSCSSEQFMGNDGSCHYCSNSNRYVSATAEECAKCDNTSTPRVMAADGRCVLPCSSGKFMGNDGSCYSCSTSSSYLTTANECSKCDGTSTPRVMSSGGRCALPCESGKVLSANGRCALPCGSGEFMDGYGSCYSCSYFYSVSTTAEECAKCDNTSTPRDMSSGGYCYKR